MGFNALSLVAWGIAQGDGRVEDFFQHDGLAQGPAVELAEIQQGLAAFGPTKVGGLLPRLGVPGGLLGEHAVVRCLVLSLRILSNG